METLESLKPEMMHNALTSSVSDSRSIFLDNENIIICLNLYKVGARKFLKLGIRNESGLVLDQSIADQVIEVFFPENDYFELESKKFPGIIRQFVMEMPYD